MCLLFFKEADVFSPKEEDRSEPRVSSSLKLLLVFPLWECGKSVTQRFISDSAGP